MDEELEELVYQIKELIATTLDVSIDQVENDSFLSDDLGADPALFEELSTRVAEEFGIEINESDVEGWETVSDVIETVLSRLDEA